MSQPLDFTGYLFKTPAAGSGAYERLITGIAAPRFRLGNSP
jgi:hypothetical protein